MEGAPNAQMPPWPIPSARPHHNRWFSALIFFFFKKCQSCAQHTWISKHNRGGQSVVFGKGEREEERGQERPHDTAWDHEQKRPWELGWVRALGREGQAHPHTRHTQPGMHALHPPMSPGWRAHVAHTAPPRPRRTSHQHPGEQGALPTSSTVWRTQPSSKQGTSFEFFRRREVRREREEGRP